MPIQRFSSFEAFMEANRHARLRPMVLGRDRGNWALTHLMVNNLSVQWGEAGGKAVIEGASRLGGLTLFLQTRGAPAFSGNGRRLDDLSLMVAQPDSEFCLAADGASRRWCSLYIPNGDLVSPDGDTKAAADSMRGVFQLPSQRMERFRSVIEQLDEAVQHAPAAFESVAAQQAAKQKLVLEIRTVLGQPRQAGHQIGRPVVPRERIISIALAFVDQHAGEYLSVEQVAAAAGVSERTLRDAFQRYFGVSPVRYLNLRTLHQVRGVLKAADPSLATVTGIAAQFGVWQFGRFARDYRLLFNELPSQTLRDLP
ncbi:MAG: helix-turn-helix domain-containing protein [Terriglobales bacterium]|jgi:AraC family transcriptional regulator, ethanolamine operon transcriptional activator